MKPNRMLIKCGSRFDFFYCLDICANGECGLGYGVAE